MILKIDTTKPEKIAVGIYDSKSKIKDSEQIIQKFGSQALLPSIVKILKKHKKNFSDIKSIEVYTGPGSFTGTRVGVSVANALGFALDVPVNGKKGKIALPIYQKSKFG